MTTPTLFLPWPDGSQPVVERFIERTAVTTAFDGSERRVACRAQPRYELSGFFLLMDADKAALASLEVALEVAVPAWCHPFAPIAPATLPAVKAIHTAGTSKRFLVGNPYGPQGLRDQLCTVATGTGNLTSGYTTADRLASSSAYPVFNGLLSSDSFSVEILGANETALLTNLVFSSDTVPEPVVNSVASTPAILDRILVHNPAAGNPNREVAHSVNRFDGGNIQTAQLRHTKKSLAVNFTAIGRADILEARRFLVAQRGRLNAFQLRDPRDGVLKTWRLASDVLEIRYPTTHVAEFALRLVELPAVVEEVEE